MPLAKQSPRASRSERILNEICAIPTAPYAEHRVLTFAAQFARKRKLKLSRDATGNLLLEIPGTKSRSRGNRLVLVAHCDHPGLVARRMLGPGRLEADFHGGVLSSFVLGARVRFFDAAGEVTGIVGRILKPSDRGDYAARVQITGLARDVAPAAPGMFDLPVCRIRAGKFHNRACDDIAGVASALAALDELSRKPPAAPVAVLITRAEEDAFVGALATVIRPKLLRRTDRIISIECSAQQPYAQQGNGVILRVGDYTSIFDSALTYFLLQQAVELNHKDRAFKFQRSLMPGGTCEATVFDAWGYTCGAVCVPLGNYHNMDRDTGKIAAEFIDLADWHNMVKLLTRLAQTIHTFEPGMAALRKRLTKHFLSRAPRLANPLG